MKRKVAPTLCLLGTIFLLLFPCLGIAETAEPTVRYEYLGIPFDTVTPQQLEQILQEQFGEVVKDEHDNDYIVSDFGYDFYLDVDFNDNNIGAFRVTLMKTGKCYAPYDEFRDLFEKDILQFLDMEKQLSQRYGEPRWRYFTANNAKYLGHNVPMRMMFPSGQWSYEEMMSVLDNDSQTLIAYSRWENIRLEVWVDWKNEKTRGYLSKLNVFFESDSWPSSAQPMIIEYPPTADE